MFNVRRDQCKKSNRRLHLLKALPGSQQSY